MNEPTAPHYSTPTEWRGYQEAAVTFAAALMRSGQMIEKDPVELGCDYADQMARALHARRLRDATPRTAITFYDSPVPWLHAVAGPKRVNPDLPASPELKFLWRYVQEGHVVGSFVELATVIEQMPTNEIAQLYGVTNDEPTLRDFRASVVKLVRNQYPVG